MNKIPLPLHLIVSVPGFALLGQTSFGGYFKIIFAWWLNYCPDPFVTPLEYGSLSGMQKNDYNRYKDKIEPVLNKTFVVLSKYYEECYNKRDVKINNAKKATIKRLENIEIRKRQSSGGRLKDERVSSNVPVNPMAIKPPEKSFHDGWNLHKNKSNFIKKNTKNMINQASLRDK